MISVTLVVIVVNLFYYTKLDADIYIPMEAPKLTQVKTSLEFERIGRCESHNDPLAKNPYSSASGRFQFLWNTWHHYGLEFWGADFYNKNIWDYADNTELAWYVYQKYGSSDWLSSKSCWQK